MVIGTCSLDIYQRLLCWPLVRLHLRHAQHFLGRRNSGADQTPSIFTQAAHVAAAGGFTNFSAGTVFENHTPNLVIAIHPLEDGAAAMIAGLATLAATDCAINRN